jgi:hypothetical protein
MDVDLFERAAGLEVGLDVGHGFDVAAPGDGRLDNALLRRDDLPLGPSLTRRRTDLDERGDDDQSSDEDQEE